MNRFPRLPALSPLVTPPPQSSAAGSPRRPAEPSPLNRGARGRVQPRPPLSGLRSPTAGNYSPAAGIRLEEPGLKDVAAGWVAKHPAAGLGVAATAGLALGWLLKRR